MQILIGDVFDRMADLADDSIECCVSSFPYWGLRDYGVDGQIGLEPTLGEHIEVVVRVCEEIRRVLKPDGTFWLNYGDCYATTPNGRSAAATKEAGTDDRTFRDKPVSTIGPIHRDKRMGRGTGRWGGGNNPSGPVYVPDYNPEPRGTFTSGDRQCRREGQGRVVAGGYLKPKDLCMIPNRIAIALQDAGWWVRSEIIWHKPNPMPESITDRPGTSHEKIFLLTKSPRYFYDAEAVKVPASPDTHARYARGRSDDHKWADGGPGDQSIAKSFSHMQKPVAGWSKERGAHTTTGHNLPGVHPKSAPAGSGIKANESFSAAVKDVVDERNLRNVWTVPTQGFSEAHFATFPPKLIEPCIKAGCPKGGTVLDPFGGAGTTALVADRLDRNAILIELNPEYAEIAKRRLEDDGGMFSQVTAA